MDNIDSNQNSSESRSKISQFTSKSKQALEKKSEQIQADQKHSRVHWSRDSNFEKQN